MTLQLDVSTLAGEVFTVQAKEQWSVWELKCAVEEVSGVHGSKQKLINCEFDELLNERPLQDFCLVGDEAVQLALVILGKSLEEADWCERWATVTPYWLQRGTENVIDNNEFAMLRALNCTQGACALHPKPARCNCSSGPFGAGGHARGYEPIPAKHFNVLERGKEVLIALKRRPYELRCGQTGQRLHKGSVELKWTDPRELDVHTRHATFEAVFAAIKQEPDIVMPQLFGVSLAVAVMQHCPGYFAMLPQHLQDSRQVLYAAMEVDPALETEFRSTAGTTEIREWEWYQDDSGSRKAG